MSTTITGLNVPNPEFYLNNENALWLSTVKFDKNVGKKIALVDGTEPGSKVHGIVKLQKPIPIENINDVVDRVPPPAFEQFRNVDKQIYTYPLEVQEKFQQPKEIQDGLKQGQRLFIKNLTFKRTLLDDFEEFDQPKTQKYHDRIHSIVEKKGYNEYLFNIHYFMAEQFDKLGMTHPQIDELDWAYEMFAEDEEMGPACRKSNESKKECVNRKMSELKKEDPNATHTQRLGKALGICEQPCSEDNSEDINEFIANIGMWTPEQMKDWHKGFNDEQAMVAAKAANRRFAELAAKNTPLLKSMQLAIGHGAARGDNHE